MIRVRIIASSQTDQDVEAQVAAIGRLPRVLASQPTRPLENRFALLAREATRIVAASSSADILLTVGEAALVSAMLGWRGPLIHLPVGPFTRTERRLLRWRGPSGSAIAVTSTHTAAKQAIQSGVPGAMIRVIRPTPPALHASRQSVRDAIGIPLDTTCVLLAGQLRGRSKCQRSLRAAGVLTFLYPEWRILIDPGNHSDFLRRIIRSTAVPGTMILCDRCSASEQSVAADVCIVDADAVPAYVAIASAAELGVPMVADRVMWRREQLESIPARFVAENKARSWARAVADAAEEPRAALSAPASVADPANGTDPVVRQWLHVLHTVCGRRASQFSLGLA